MAGENLNPDPDDDKGKGEPKTVPLEALEAERRKRQDSDTRVAELQGQVRGLTAVKTEPKVDSLQEKQWSAAELRQAIDEGKLTEDESETIKARQIEKRVTAKVTEEVETTLARKNLGERVSTEAARYKRAIPDLLDQSSAAFGKVQTEFTYLIAQGYDANDPRTELIAVRGAFGDIDQLEKIGKPGERETHQETGGGGEPGSAEGNKDSRSKDMPPKGLSRDAKKHYGAQIERGMYPDWAAVSKELEGASPSVKVRLGI